MNYWLFKSEPETFSIFDFEKRPKQTEHWDGVRNYQARNMLRDKVKVGDVGFFYHSRPKAQPVDKINGDDEPGIVGTFKVVKAGYPDFTSWNIHSKYFDPKSTPDHPRWFMVDIQLTKIFNKKVHLKTLKKHPILQHMLVAQRGNRLSITPITQKEWMLICKMANV